MTMEYNSEKLKEIYKKALLDSVKARMLLQDLRPNNIMMMEALCRAKIDNVGYLLGKDYIMDWRNQTGEDLDIALYSLFRIKRFLNGTTLTDDEFKVLGNFASISSVSNISIFVNLVNGLAIFNKILYAVTYRQKENNVLRIYVYGEIVNKIVAFVKHYKLISVAIGSRCEFVQAPNAKQMLLMPDGEIDYSSENQNNLVIHRMFDGTKNEAGFIRL